jgi:hypothetical protein
MKWLSGFSLAATFEGEFSGNVSNYAGKGVANDVGHRPADRLKNRFLPFHSRLGNGYYS